MNYTVDDCRIIVHGKLGAAICPSYSVRDGVVEYDYVLFNRDGVKKKKRKGRFILGQGIPEHTIRRQLEDKVTFI